ncbi:hypothetical protein [Streptomyces tsukubensis]|uniref:hypothetical protein n=1 Tax=Streptomyces tsukubensis TaxID=83656 RepID=UPI00344DB32E
MNALELRMLIHRGLIQYHGTQYGEIKNAEPLPPEGGAARLRITAPDPSGSDRVFMVTITETD